MSKNTEQGAPSFMEFKPLTTPQKEGSRINPASWLPTAVLALALLISGGIPLATHLISNKVNTASAINTVSGSVAPSSTAAAVSTISHKPAAITGKATALKTKESKQISATGTTPARAANYSKSSATSYQSTSPTTIALPSTGRPQISGAAAAGEDDSLGD